MLRHTVTLPMLDMYLATRRKGLTFPPALEALYDEQMQSYRLKVMARGILPAVLTYNVFLLADLLLVPQTLLLSSALHLLVVTPAILVVAVLYPKAKRQWLRELAATAIPLLMVAQIMFVFSLNRGEAADQYQYLAVMVVIYMNVNQRFGFRLAVASTLVLVATYLGTLLPSHSAFVIKFVGASLMASAAYLSLMANRRMEQDLRFAFLRRLQDQLRRQSAEHEAKQDALTGLPNRRKLDEAVEKLWDANDETAPPVAVLMIDIDHFKPFNDRYGHAAGDTCLKRVAGAIAAELRKDRDLAVRLGGEEFVMLLPQADLSEAKRVGERVRRRVEELAIPHESFGPRGVVTASVGVAAGPIPAHSFAELLSGADAALYAAKRNGRNQVWPPFVSRGNPVAVLDPVAKSS